MTPEERHDFYCPDAGLGCNANNPMVRAGCSMMVALKNVQNDEMERWISALKELGFQSSPGVSVKENLNDFARWWAREGSR